MKCLVKNLTMTLPAHELISHRQTVNIKGFIYNMSLVTLGSIIEGIVFLAISYYFISKEKIRGDNNGI